jgi:Domain of unknown function (DUF4396)
VDSTWREAITATRHCLTGCAIGEVLGMVIATAAGWGNAASIAISIVLAFFFGYLLTFTGVRRAGLPVRDAVRVALAADTVSIAVMELVDNGTLLVWPAAMDAGLLDWLFWISLAVSLAVAFVVTVPVNRVMIGRGLGHAKAHAAHSGHAGHAGHAEDPAHSGPAPGRAEHHEH